MRVIITAATVAEWMPSFLELDPLYSGESQRLKVQFHQSGVGMLASAVSITRMVYEDKPDLIIQAGIAGCFDTNQALGNVVVIADELVGDMGVQEEGKWKDLFDLKLEKSNYHPYEKRKLPNPWLNTYNLMKLQEVSGITVNEITTEPERIRQLYKKYNPTTEAWKALPCTMYAAKPRFLLSRSGPSPTISASGINPTGVSNPPSKTSTKPSLNTSTNSTNSNNHSIILSSYHLFTHPLIHSFQ